MAETCQSITDGPIDLGESSLKTEIYKATLSAGTASVADLAAKCGLTIEQAMSVVAELKSSGILSQSRTDQNAVRALSPQLALARRAQALAKSLVTDAQEFEMIARAIETDGNAPQPEILTNIDVITSRISDILSAATTSVDSLLPTLPKSDTLELAYSDDIALAERKIELRAIYPEAARFDKGISDYLKSLKAQNAEIRTNLNTPIRLIIIDNQIVYLQTRNQKNPPYAMLTKHSLLVDSFSALFETVWEQSRVFNIHQADDDISQKELSVLRSLLTKTTDDAIARDLSMSPREVTRQVSGLYRRTGTSTRFALAVEAVRRGWLEVG